MARHFVILYCGREGSSAIIKAFANGTDVATPVTEEFDRYQCAGVDENKVPTILRHMLATARFSTNVDRAFDQLPTTVSPPAPAVGFKWRIWGAPENIAEVLRDYDVVVFELLRSDIVNLALSLYLTTHVLPFQKNHRFAKIFEDPNPQFRIRWLAKDDQEEVIRFIRSREFAVDLKQLVPIMEEYVASRQQLRQRYVALFKTCRLDVHTLYYEDFLANASDFLSRMAGNIGTTIDPKQDLFYPKVSRDDIRTQITNLTELESNRDVQRIKLSYHCNLIAKPVECGAN
jgi:hypothetical protein